MRRSEALCAIMAMRHPATTSALSISMARSGARRRPERALAGALLMRGAGGAQTSPRSMPSSTGSWASRTRIALSGSRARN